MHRMLLALRGIKGPRGEVSQLNCNIYRIPKVEPWKRALPCDPALPNILTRHCSNRRDRIYFKGENGLGTHCKPTTFPLQCPKCDTCSERVSCTLCDLTPRSINCQSCKSAITSSKWRCTCGMPWLECNTHRSQGFRCGNSRCRNIATRTSIHSYHVARARQSAKTKKLNKVGPLGSDKLGLSSVHHDSGNVKEPYEDTGGDGRTQKDIKKQKSVHHSSFQPIVTNEGFFNQANNLNCANSARPGWFFNQATQTQCSSLRGHNSHYDHGERSSSSQDGSIYKNPKRPLEGGGGDVRTPRCVVDNFDCFSDVSNLAIVSVPRKFPKRTSCKGNCPLTGWSVDQYCEQCHG